MMNIPTKNSSDKAVGARILPLEGQPMTPEEILENARALRPYLKENSARIEEGRCLPPEVHQRLLQAGMFRMTMPRIWGGPEMNSMQQIEVIEEVARGNGSAAWCVMIGCDSGLYSSFLEDEDARALYPRLDMVQAGWFAPMGSMRRVDGGVIVNGRWSFASGCMNADRMAGGCLLTDDKGELVMDNGLPIWRQIIAPAESFEIIDTWQTSGLRGTGSHDYAAQELFVPEKYVFNLFGPPKREGTLYLKNDHFIRKMPAISLGIAREAIDYALGLLQQKVDMFTQTRYADSARVQLAVSEAETLVRSARAYLFSALETQWRRMDDRQPLEKTERQDLVLSRALVFQNCRKAAQIIYDAVGAGAVYTSNHPLDGYLRDLNTACQHLVAQNKTKEWVGQFMLSGEESWPFL